MSIFLVLLQGLVVPAGVFHLGPGQLGQPQSWEGEGPLLCLRLLPPGGLRLRLLLGRPPLFLYDQELIFPPKIAKYYPWYANHMMHTAPILSQMIAMATTCHVWLGYALLLTTADSGSILSSRSCPLRSGQSSLSSSPYSHFHYLGWGN